MEMISANIYTNIGLAFLASCWYMVLKWLIKWLIPKLCPKRHPSTSEDMSSSSSVLNTGTNIRSCEICSLFAGKRCSNCHVAYYCSVECQEIHWRQGHKEECHHLTTPNESNDAGSSNEETVTLSDPDVLTCAICFKYLYVPVYQCKNGHIMCPICYNKVKDFCPFCNMHSQYYRCRAIEKILELAKAACQNKKYGCTKILQWNDKNTHETGCLFPPCCCPIDNCVFLGTSSQLFSHFREEDDDVIKISNNQSFSTTLSQALGFQVFLEVEKENVFILHNQRQAEGNAFSISVLGQKITREQFFYKLKVRHGGYTKSIKGPTDIIQSYQVDHAPTQSLIVPDSYFDDLHEIKLKLCLATDSKRVPHQDSRGIKLLHKLKGVASFFVVLVVICFFQTEVLRICQNRYETLLHNDFEDHQHHRIGW